MFGFSIIAIVITIIASCIIVGAYFVYNKWHNPVEQEMATLIKNEVGINIDNYLPEDSSTVTTIETDAPTEKK